LLKRTSFEARGFDPRIFRIVCYTDNMTNEKKPKKRRYCHHPKRLISKQVMASEVVWTCICGYEVVRRARRLMD
jgi:hypothetical protein